jgi:hypothetical protein
MEEKAGSILGDKKNKKIMCHEFHGSTPNCKNDERSLKKSASDKASPFHV